MLLTPYNMTMGMFSIVVAFSISYNLAKQYKLSGLINGIIGLLMFLMVATPVTSVEVLAADGTTSMLNVLQSNLLGSSGVFTAMIISIVSVELTQLCVSRNWVVKLPDVVPPSLNDSFTAMVPLLLNVILIYGFNILCITVFGSSIPELIVVILSAPLQAVNSVPGVLLIITFASILWIMGIHGTSIVYPFVLPSMKAATMANADLVGSGLAPVFAPIMLFSAVQVAGGTGNTLGLSFLASRSKSKQLNSIGKVSLVPSIFGINEPVIFGVPVMFNPILAIPFVLSPIVMGLVMWFLYSVGFMKPGYIIVFASLPIGMSSALGSMSIMNPILIWAILVPLSVVIYYPFFKVYEKQLIEQEAAAELAEQSLKS